MDDPDLTAELDAAEDIVMGRAERVVVQWGIQRPDLSTGYYWCGMGRNGEEAARLLADERYPAVRRTVTFGPVEEVPADPL